MAIVLADLVSEKNLALDLRGTDETGAIRELVDLLQKNRELIDGGKFFAEVIAREKVSSTAMGNGVAFPHARTNLVDKLVLAIGRSANGVRFGENNEKVRLIFLIGVPRQLTNDYLVCVGALARIVKNQATHIKLLAVENAGEFVELIRAESLLLE